MSSDSYTILTEMHDRAKCRGWKDVETTCQTLLSPPDGRILVVVPDDVDPQAFIEWLRPLAAHSATIERTSIAALAVDPILALRAAQVFALFAVARFPDDSDIDLVADHILQRPAGTRAVVLLTEEYLVGSEDMQAARKLAWGLFVPEPKPAYSGQLLSEHGVFLWHNRCQVSDTVAADLAALRLLVVDRVHDAKAQHDLARLRTEFALGLAAQAASNLESDHPAASTSADLYDAVTDVEGRLVEKARALTGELEVSLLATLRGVQQDLRSDLPEQLHRKIVTVGRCGEWVSAVERLLHDGVSDRLRAWQGTAEATADTTRRLWQATVDQLFSDLDWETLRPSGVGAASAKAISGGVPDLASLRSRLQRALDLIVLTGATSPDATVAAWHPAPRTRPKLLATAASTAVGAAVGTALGGPFGAVAGGAAGAIGTYGYISMVNREEAMAGLRETGEHEIEREVARARQWVRDRIVTLRAGLIAACREEMVTLASEIVVAGQAGNSAPAEREEDLRAIAAWSRDLHAAQGLDSP